MARSELADPLSKFRWTVSIDQFKKAGFSKCETPSFRATTHNYAEGGAHLAPRQILNSVDYAPIRLERGVTNDTSFNNWVTGHFDLVQNSEGMNVNPAADAIGGSNSSDLDLFDEFTTAAPGLAGAVKSSGLLGPSPVESFTDGGRYRKTVTIKHINRGGQTVVEYILHGAWPIEYKPASDFDASDDDNFSIESITLAYDSFEVRYSGLAGSLAAIAAQKIF